MMGQDKVVELLLGMKRVDVNSKEGKEGTPLFVAAMAGHENVIRLILKTNKVKIDSTNWKGDTALSAAAAGGHEVVVRLLLGTGKASVTTVNRDGETPLMRAARKGHLKTVKLLLEKGNAKPDFDAARCAAYGGHRTVVEALLDTSKADVDKFLMENPSEIIPTITALGGETTTLKNIAKLYADQPVRLWSRDGVY
jgi:ankyrin repeat protein